MTIPANVLRVDRAAQRAEVLLAGTSRPIRASYEDKKRPPPPLAQVAVEQTSSGLWTVRDGISIRELLLHDDFNLVSNIGGVMSSDSVWLVAGTGFGVAQSNAVPGPGVCRLITTNTPGSFINIAKDDLSITLPDDSAVWLSATLTPDTLSLTDHSVGFSDNAAVDMAQIVFHYGTGQLTIGGNGATVTIPFTPTPFSLYTVDIVLHAGRFMAAWVNGDGPYVNMSGVPAAGSGTQPFLYIKTDDSTDHSLYSDWVHVEAFTAPIHPDRVTFIATAQA